MRICAVIFLLALTAAGCTTRSTARTEARLAFLAGQNAALRQQLAEQSRCVTIHGPVEKSSVPWVDGLTLSQAIATANYLAPNDPREISITRHGETATLDAGVLLSGVAVPLEPGDVVELR